MSTKAQEPIRTGTDKIPVILTVSKIRRRGSKFTVSAEAILKAKPKEFVDLQEELRERIGEKTEVFSMIQEVHDVMTAIEWERDDDGKKKRNPQNEQWIPVEWDIETQRLINQVLDEIDPLLDKFGSVEDHKESTVELSPEVAEYLAQRMQTHFNESFAVGRHVEEGYDYFVDIESEAQKLIKKKKPNRKKK